MTSPVAHDYPDWGRQVASSDVTVLNHSASISGDTNLGTFFVGITPYLYLRLETAAAINAELTVRWLSATAGVEIGQDTIVIRGLDVRAQLSIPVRAPFAEFSVRLSAFPNTVTVRIFSIHVPAQQQMANDTNRLILQDGVSVAAGATAIVHAGEVRTGWCYWQAVFRDATDGFIQLSAVDFAGTARILDTMGPKISTVGRLILIPPMPLRLSATNNDAAARPLHATVLFRTFDT